MAILRFFFVPFVLSMIASVWNLELGTATTTGLSLSLGSGSGLYKPRSTTLSPELGAAPRHLAKVHRSKRDFTPFVSFGTLWAHAGR